MGREGGGGVVNKRRIKYQYFLIHKYLRGRVCSSIRNRLRNLALSGISSVSNWRKSFGSISLSILGSSLGFFNASRKWSIQSIITPPSTRCMKSSRKPLIIGNFMITSQFEFWNILGCLRWVFGGCEQEYIIIISIESYISFTNSFQIVFK